MSKVRIVEVSVFSKCFLIFFSIVGNWDSGESGMYGDAVMISKSTGKFHDEPFSGSRNFICQLDV